MGLIKRFPVAAYFILVFLLTWGGVFLISKTLSSASGIDETTAVAFVSLPMLLTPIITAVLLTALTEGKTGLGVFWRRMTHWQVGLRWYLFALLVMPLAVLAILYSLAYLFSPQYAPVLSLLGLAGLAAGYLEEFGWTGYATPRLLQRWRPLTAGLVIGVLWGVWHAMADYTIRGATLGAYWPVAFALFVIPLTAWRILMVWAYDETQSGIVAQIMHFSYTGSLALFVPIAVLSPQQDALVYVLLAVLLWAGVAVLALYLRRRLTATRTALPPFHMAADKPDAQAR